MRAIDVSLYQKTIDWDAVKRGQADGLPVSWAFIKCGQRNYNDKFFERNWAESKRVGIKRGAYWYSDTGHDPIAQAWLFWNSIKDDVGEGRPVIDIEQDATPTRADFNFHMRLTREFESVSGITPIIYTRAGWWNACTDGADYSRYPLWVANYKTASNPITKPVLPRGWAVAAIWQYTDSGNCSGIAGNVDCNFIYDESAILLSKAPPLPDTFPIQAKTTRATTGYRRSSGAGDTLASVDIAGVGMTIHDIDTERRTALASTNLQAWYSLDTLQLGIPQPAKPEPPPVTPQPPTQQPIKLGYNVLNAGLAMSKADAGCRFFMLQDVGVARQIKRKYPDAVVMVRWFHDKRKVTAEEAILALSPSLDDELVFTLFNENQARPYHSYDDIRVRASFDLAFARMLKERAPKSVFAAGGFSSGEPFIDNDTEQRSLQLRQAFKDFYAPHYNSGLMSMNFHTYTRNLTEGMNQYHASRWRFLFTHCGFNVESTSRIYSGETGVDTGLIGGVPVFGFSGIGATQAQVNDWVIRFKALQAQPVNGKPSPFVGGAVFCLGENADERWLPFRADGYEVFR